MHIADGVRLVIDAGAVVNGYDAEIVVFGELKTVGKEGNPCVFNDVVVRNGKGGYVNMNFAEVRARVEKAGLSATGSAGSDRPPLPPHR